MKNKKKEASVMSRASFLQQKRFFEKVFSKIPKTLLQFHSRGDIVVVKSNGESRFFDEQLVRALRWLHEKQPLREVLLHRIYNYTKCKFCIIERRKNGGLLIFTLIYHISGGKNDNSSHTKT